MSNQSGRVSRVARYGAALFSMLVLQAAHAQDCKPTVDNALLVKPGTLIMSLNATLPPRQFVDTTGKLRGYGVELGELIAKTLCLKPEFVNIEFAAQIPGLQSGRWDIVATGLFYTPERGNLMHMVPYGVEDIAITAAKGNPLKIAKTQELSNLRVGVESGSYQERETRKLNDAVVAQGGKPIQVRTFDNFAHIYAALSAGQLDAVSSSGLVGAYYAERGNFSTAIRGLSPTALAYGMKSKPLAEAIAQALVTAKANGTFDALHKKWGALPYGGEFRITTGELKLN